MDSVVRKAYDFIFKKRKENLYRSGFDLVSKDLEVTSHSFISRDEEFNKMFKNLKEFKNNLISSKIRLFAPKDKLNSRNSVKLKGIPSKSFSQKVPMRFGDPNMFKKKANLGLDKAKLSSVRSKRRGQAKLDRTSLHKLVENKNEFVDAFKHKMKQHKASKARFRRQANISNTNRESNIAVRPRLSSQNRSIDGTLFATKEVPQIDSSHYYRVANEKSNSTDFSAKTIFVRKEIKNRREVLQHTFWKMELVKDDIKRLIDKECTKVDKSKINFDRILSSLK